MDEKSGRRSRDRVLGDEWLDWHGSDEPSEIREGKRTFLLLSLVVIVGFVSLSVVFWYLVLPRFEQFGRTSAAILTALVAVGALFFLVWYGILIAAVFSRRFYISMCLNKGRRLFFMLFPFVSRLAATLGISRDRIGHSFIEVSNRLACSADTDGAVLALIPRCLSPALKREIQAACCGYPDVVVHTAPGGAEARKYIRDVHPRAIIAVACERDLMGGIHDVAPHIPVIGIPNTRPHGPCKETQIDMDRFREALRFFCGISGRD